MTDGPLIFTGSSSQILAEAICDYLGIALGRSETRSFSDGETWVKIDENVRGRKCFVVQSTHCPVNDSLFELLLMIDALRRASASGATAVVPYFGYARQDRKDQGRVALSAKLVANMITTSGADRVLTMDLHSGQIQGFFDIPVDHLYASPVLVQHIRKLKISDLVVVSPDVGSVKRGRAYADKLDAPLAIIDKRRSNPNESEVMHLIGDVKGRNAFIFDDLIDTAGTICNAASALKKHGAKEVYAACTHAVLSGRAVERLNASCIRRLFTTDTIQPREQGLKNLDVVSVAPMLGEAIQRIYEDRSVSALFE